MKNVEENNLYVIFNSNKLLDDDPYLYAPRSKALLVFKSLFI